MRLNERVKKLFTAVSGYYDGHQIVPDENISLYNGQRVIITILGTVNEITEKDSYLVASDRESYEKKFQNLEKLDRISNFEQDWDGNGAQKFSQKFVLVLRNIIQKLIWQPDIAPTAAGGLVLQYNDNGRRLAYNIEEEKTERVYAPDNNLLMAECATLKTGKDLYTDINRYAERIYG